MNAMLEMDNVVTRKVILANGTSWNGIAALNADNDVLWVTLDKGPTLAEAFLAFNDPQNTVKIKTSVELIISRVEERKEYLNYTRLTDIKFQGEEILVRLQRPV